MRISVSVGSAYYDGENWGGVTSGTPVRLRGIWGAGSGVNFAVGDTQLVMIFDEALEL